MAIDDYLVRNSTENIIEVYLVGTNGKGFTGAAIGDISITAFKRGTSGAAVAANPIAGTIDTFVSNGWIEVDNVNKPGLYQYSIPNAIITTAATKLYFVFEYTGAGTATSFDYEVILVPAEPYLGAKLSTDGLDFIAIEGINGRQAIELMASVLCGTTVGADSNKTIFKAVGNPAVDRVGSTVDSATGNRTQIDLTPSS